MVRIMAKELHKKRNQRLNMANKIAKYDEAYSLKTKEARNAIAVEHVIDVNKRSPRNPEPKMLE